MSHYNSEDAPINWKEGLDAYGGDEGVFVTFLSQFEEMSFTETMESLFQSMMSMDYPKIHYFAHKLKSPASYIAANRSKDLAAELVTASDRNDQKAVTDKFLKLLIESKALIIYISKVVGKPPNISALERYEREFKNKYSKSKSMRRGESSTVDISAANNQAVAAGCCSDCNMF